MTLIIFLVILAFLIFAHELGHFIAAKASGVYVEEFSIGFPPRIWKKRRGETRYSIGAIPFGGYVKMLGELEESSDPRSFEKQSVLKRIIISVSGVLTNFLLAWILLSVGFSVGMYPIVSSPDQLPGKKLEPQVVVAQVEEGSVAKDAGIEPGTILQSIGVGDDRVELVESDDLSRFTQTHQGEEVSLVLLVGDKEQTKEVKLSEDNDAPLGVGVVDRAKIQVPWYMSPSVALRETVHTVEETLSLFGSAISGIFTRGEVGDGVGGPVAIYVFTGLFVKEGFIALMQFVALLSISLAIVNILPFPALDGGRLVFILLEGMFGKKIVKEKVENIIHLIGFALLIIIFILITYRDIVNFF